MDNYFKIKNGVYSPIFSGGTYYGDGSNLTGIASEFTGGTVAGDTVFTQNVSGGTMHLIINSDAEYTNVNQYIEVGRDIFTGYLVADGHSNSEIGISYDITTRKVTLTAPVGGLKLFVHGKEILALTAGNTWVSDAHATGATGTQFLYYSHITNTYVWNSSSWAFEDGQIAAVIYDASGNYVMTLRETHGIMQPCVHKELHQTISTYLSSGGDFSGYVLNSTTATNRRPLLSTSYVQDEDLQSIVTGIITNSYTRYEKSGDENNMVFTTGSTEIVNVSGNQPYFNQLIGTAWTQTLMSNNSYMVVWVVAIPASDGAVSQSKRLLFIQGQQNSSSLTTIQALTTSSVNFGPLATLSPEFVFIGKIILQYSSSNWRLTSVEKLVGTKLSQTAISGNFLSTVSVDGVTITGDGTISNPLVATGSGTFTGGTVTNLQVTGTLSGATLSSDVDSIIAVRNLYLFNNFQ